MFKIEKSTVAKPTLVGRPKKTRDTFAVVYQGQQVGCTFGSETDAQQFVAELQDAHSRGSDFFAAFLNGLAA